jgi:hypothetical protein
MSDETFAAVEDAIRAHVADCADGAPRLLTDWYVITAAVGEEMAENHYLHVCSETAMHSLHGLVDLAHRRLLSDAGSYDEE